MNIERGKMTMECGLVDWNWLCYNIEEIDTSTFQNTICLKNINEEGISIETEVISMTVVFC